MDSISMDSFEVLLSEQNEDVEENTQVPDLGVGIANVPRAAEEVPSSLSLASSHSSIGSVVLDLTVAELCQRLKNLSQENIDLKDKMQRNNKITHEQLNRIVQINSKHHAKLDDVMKQNQKLQSEKEELEKKIADLTAEVQCAHSENQKLQSEKEKLEKIAEVNIARSTVLNILLAENEEKTQGLTQSLENIKQEKENLQSDSTSGWNKSLTIEGECSGCQHKNMIHVQLVDWKGKEQDDTLVCLSQQGEQINVMQSILKAVQQKLLTAEERLDLCQNRNLVLNAELEDCKGKLEKTLHSHSQQGVQINMLQAELKTVQQKQEQLDLCQNRYMTLNAEQDKDKLQKALHSDSQEGEQIGLLLPELETLQKKILAAEKQLNSFQNRNLSLEDKLKTILNEVELIKSDMVRHDDSCYLCGIYKTENGQILVKQPLLFTKYTKHFFKFLRGRDDGESICRIVLEGVFESLKAIEATNSIRVPKPLALIACHSDSDPNEYGNPIGDLALIQEAIVMSKLTDYEAFGKLLAKMHLHNESQKNKPSYVSEFGFHVTTCLNGIPQDNTWNRDWVNFFIRQRLKPLFKLLKHQHGEDATIVELWRKLKIKISDFFKNLSITPALLHGNRSVFQAEYKPVFNWPASFYGHSEVDLALIKWCGNASSSFYAAYHELNPKQPGFEKREELYQLYFYLTYWNHASSSKYEVVEAMQTLLKS